MGENLNRLLFGENKAFFKKRHFKHFYNSFLLLATARKEKEFLEILVFFFHFFFEKQKKRKKKIRKTVWRKSCLQIYL